MTDKEQLQDAYLEGYKLGRSVEELDSHAIKTAKSQFERWYDINDIGENE